MPKWTSPLFTDIRNALGQSIVFSNWKGRPYMRAWTKPSNPRTNKQLVVRDLMAKLVARYQATVIVSESAPEHAATWNTEALPYSISGYNVFTKFGAKSRISVPATASGTGTATVEVTYTLGIPASKAKIYHEKGGVWTRVATALEAGTGKTLEVTVNASGNYTFWIANDEALDTGDAAPQAYQAITCWGDPATPPLDAAVPATCTVTIS
jgi:hypothetical protein